MKKEKLDERVLAKLKLSHKNEPDVAQWKKFLGKIKTPTDEVKIGLVGKYVELPDAYKSIVESFIHAGAENDCRVIVQYISSEDITRNNASEILSGLSGLLVAPGFGERGIQGKIEAIKYVRENNIPFLGICLGMQCAVIEFSRNVLGIKNASSTEINSNSKDPIIDLMEDQKNITMKGGTMRLGAYNCQIKKGTKAAAAYGKTRIKERHRHRYEFNNRYLKKLEKGGMIASGINPETDLVEIIELKNHPWFLGCQYHPELRSTVSNPHPLFIKFVKAALDHSKISL